MATPTPEVKTVTVPIKPPRPGFPGQVALGYYIVRDGVLIMTDPKGRPAEDDIGRQYKQTLRPDDDARLIASKLTKQLRSALRGNSGGPSNFNDPIVYPPTGWR